MSFHQNQNRKARCPLYESIVRSSNNKIAGIQCACMGPGPDASVIVKRRGFNDLMKFKRQFCDSVEGYRHCQFYQKFEKLNK